MKTYKRSLLIILSMIVVASAALAYVGKKEGPIRTEPGLIRGGDDLVSIETELVQEKVLKGSEGTVSLALTLEAANLPEVIARTIPEIDLVIVLDRSGSMNGQKINDACQAVTELISSLTPRDRLALIAYSSKVQEISPLVYMDEAQQRKLKTVIRRLTANGGTNLSGGLKQGIGVMMQETAAGRQRKLILVSDGLANQGITDPSVIGRIAAGAVNNHFTISTVGVGYDFNEILMTNIADHGSGQYYFLENPKAFAQVFERELQSTRNVAAAGMEIRVPLQKGISLLHAGGYPISLEGDHAVIRPGDLLSGQRRKIFLTFRVPTDEEREFIIGTVKTRYLYEGDEYQIDSGEMISVACVRDPEEVISSIDKGTWGDQVIQEDFNQLKDEVAEAIRKGRKERADALISEYEGHKRRLNSMVGSGKVTENLEGDVRILRQSVEETFSGSPSSVAEKKKEKAKALQYESYRIRRDKR